MFLLFCNDDIFSLNQWVFNANGHPLPIKGTPAHTNVANITFQGLTTAEIKEVDSKRIQPPRLTTTTTKKVLDSLMRRKLAIRNVSEILEFLYNILTNSSNR